MASRSKDSDKPNKGNSTRLPPRTKGASSRSSEGAKKGGGGLSRTQRRKMAEKEAEEKEQLRINFEACVERLMEVLAKEGGSDKPCLEDLRQQLVENDNEEGDARTNGDSKASLLKINHALDIAWSYATCYPQIDVPKLVMILAELRQLLCDKAALASKPVNRKVSVLRSDPKVDPSILDAAEIEANEQLELSTLCNISAYTTRALKTITTRIINDGEKSPIASRDALCAVDEGMLTDRQ